MNPELPFIIVGTLGMTGLMGWILKPVIEGIGRRLAGGGGSQGAALEAEVQDLHARLGELEGVAQRLVEVEDRLDFTERLLAQQRPAAMLPEGRD
jgi:hypothetical protein